MDKKWHVVTPRGGSSGGLAARGREAAARGRDKPSTPAFLDTGDHVIGHHNARKGPPHGQETHRTRCSRTPHRLVPAVCARSAPETCWKEHPRKVVREAVIGMLRRPKLGRAMRKKLRV